jgi:hypothetical protein
MYSLLMYSTKCVFAGIRTDGKRKAMKVPHLGHSLLVTMLAGPIVHSAIIRVLKMISFLPS